MYRCIIRKVAEVDDNTVAKMYTLLAAHFYNVNWYTFIEDYRSKDYVFLLYSNNTNELVGFSTQRILELNDHSVVVFSGDTIIDPHAWGSLVFPKHWGLWMLEIQRRYSGATLYWLLISKGVRTYHFLSAFFHDFAPSMKRSYQVEEITIIQLASSLLFKCPLEYKNNYFYLAAQEGSQYMREHLMPLRDTKNNEVHNFFHIINPDYTRGTELVCILKFCTDNMSSFCKRMLKINNSAHRGSTVPL